MKYLLVLAAVLSCSFSCSKEHRKSKSTKNTEPTEQLLETEMKEVPKPGSELAKAEEKPAERPGDEAPKQLPSKGDGTNTEIAINNAQSSAIFPIEEGNQWVYTLKSIKKGNVERSWEEKNSITKVDGNAIYINGEKKYSVEEGKIYKTFLTRGGAETKGLYIFTPSTANEQYSTLIGGDATAMGTVYPAKKIINVAAGTFKNCLVFDLGMEKTYVAPGVGIVKVVYGNEGGSIYQTKELVSFKVK